METASNLIVFDIPSLIRNRHRLKTAVLSPYTVNKHLYAAHAAAGPQMALFQAVQDSLHAADSVVAFGEDHLRLLMMLGARNAIRAPLPTVNIKPPPSRRFDLLIINHAADDKLLTALAKSVESDHALTASVVDCAQDDARAASAQQPPVNAMIHVHVGTSANVVAPWRIVDSYAQHKPVIHLVEPHARPAGLDLAQFQMSVEHNTSGLRLSCIREVVSSAKSLRDDTAMADLFRRNADRLNAAFNFAIEERMFGAVG